MRHNQNARRGSRGRGGGSNHHHGGNSGHHNNHQGRRVNPRVQVFDSNGPEVRIRGTAYQINEKYVTLARDAAAAGDRVLAESYLQHAEHYQRFINEMTEEFGQQQPFNNPQGQQQQPHVSHFPQTEEMQNGATAPQPDGAANGHDGNGAPAMPAPGDEQSQQPRHERRPQRHSGGNQRGNVGAVAAAAPADETDAG